MRRQKQATDEEMVGEHEEDIACAATIPPTRGMRLLGEEAKVRPTLPDVGILCQPKQQFPAISKMEDTWRHVRAGSTS